MASSALPILRRLASRSSVMRSAVSQSSVAAPRAMASSGIVSRGMAMMCAGEALSVLTSHNPHVDVLHYDHKNVKWTIGQVDYYADALAVGLLEKGLLPGDKVLSWLPSHLQEQHVLQFACSKAGFVLYNLDPAEAVTDPEGAKKSLGQALEVTEANVLITQEAGSDVSYLQLCKFVIPEIRIFDFADGYPFFTPRFPHLRFPIHTGFDNDDKEGMVAYKHMLSPSGKLAEILRDCGVPAPNGRSPLYGELVKGKDGQLSKGKIMTNEEVYKANIWPEFTSVLNKEHTKVRGIGVIL